MQEFRRIPVKDQFTLRFAQWQGADVIHMCFKKKGLLHQTVQQPLLVL